MKYEVIETQDAWIVNRNGVELERFDAQLEALHRIAEWLRSGDDTGGSYSLSMRYRAPA